MHTHFVGFVMSRIIYIAFFFLFFTALDKILFSEMKKDDTFGQDDKDWDVYKEIVSHNVFCLTNIGIIHDFFFMH